MSDCFTQAVSETLVALKDIRAGLGTPPSASTRAVDCLRALIPHRAAASDTPKPSPRIHKQSNESPRPAPAPATPVVEVLFVGDASDPVPDSQGAPSPADQLLTKIIIAMGFSQKDVRITSLPSRPASGEPCPPGIEEQIRTASPKVIIALGTVAAKSLLGATENPENLRGHWRTYRDIPVMTTSRPADLLRDQSIAEKRRLWEDMLQVLEKLGKPISEKQRQFFTKPAAR